jgi:Lon protease-like protein
MTKNLGLFPLDLVLLPGERVPLHIFEERYKVLIDECLRDDAAFGIVLADDSGVRAVGTEATVVEVLERFPDGRLNIMVEGRDRFRVVSVTEGRSFITADVVAEPEADDAPSPPVLEACIDAYQRVVAETSATPQELGGGGVFVSFQIAAQVDFGTEIRQQLLEMRSERARVERLVPLLESAAAAVRHRRLVRERAKGNGRVDRG